MEALRLEFQPNLKSKILELLSTFSSEELTIVDANLVNESKNKLEKAYADFKSGTAQFCSIEELDLLLDETFSKYDS